MFMGQRCGAVWPVCESSARDMVGRWEGATLDSGVSFARLASWWRCQEDIAHKSVATVEVRGTVPWFLY